MMKLRLADRIKQIRPSATLAVTAKAKAMKAKGLSIINFAAGEPDFDTPVYIKKAAKQAIDKGKTKYTPTVGTAELRKAVCEELKRSNNLVYEPGQIIVSNGAKHSLYNIFQAICNDTDEVIILSPYWVSYPEMVRLSGAKPVFVKLKQQEGFKPNIKSIKSAITAKTKALVLNSPSNPTGAICDPGILEQIAEIAVKKNILLISDEIYKRLIYDGVEHISIASLSDEIKDLTVVVGGVSKTYAMTGWRIGYLASTNSHLINAITNIQDHSTSNPSSVSQEAALCALESEEKSVKDMLAEFQRRRDYMADNVNKIKTLYCVKPQGAFYCFCDISKTGMKSLEFVNRLLEEEKVAAIPGEAFGSPSHIRLSFATAMEDITEGLDRIKKFVSNL